MHGLTGAAGQPFTISRAQRRLHIEADCVSIAESKFRYGSDRHIEIGADEQRGFSDFLIAACRDYDVFHFYFRSCFFFDSKRLDFPTGLDLLALRAAGKIVVFHYRGSEVRVAEKFRQFSPFNYVDENPHHIFDKFPQETVDAFMDYVRGVANLMLVPDPELQSYVPGSEIAPRAIDLDKWQYVGVPDDDLPLVVHAPSRRVVKGTDAVLQALSDLKAEGLKFRFQLVENMTNDEARQTYQKASIIVDQLRIGWHGVLAVESWALGKATVSYIRDDLAHHIVPQGGIANANPHTIKRVLRDLIKNLPQRKQLGAKGREYCERVHDSDVVARDLIARYEKAASDRTPASIDAILNYFLVQRGHLEKQNVKSCALPLTTGGRIARLFSRAREYGFAYTARHILKHVRQRTARLVHRKAA
jgi:glycosyltransferase involved in cell wall biosynthesis